MFDNKRLRKFVFDQDEIEALIQENYTRIYKYCFYHIENRDVAQDITQDVFFKFIKELDRYKEYGKLSNYLYVIAKNSIRDYRRKIKDVDFEIAEDKCVDGGIGKKLEQIYIWEALNSLDELERDIIVLRYYQGLRIKDIAEIINIPVSTVQYKIKNVEKKLKKRLEL